MQSQASIRKIQGGESLFGEFVAVSGHKIFCLAQALHNPRLSFPLCCLVKHIAQHDEDAFLGNGGIPVPDKNFVHLVHIPEIAPAQADNSLNSTARKALMLQEFAFVLIRKSGILKVWSLA